MKKKLSAALLSFMLVFQVMSSGYLAPFTALANEAPTTQLNDEETPQPKEKTAEEIAAADKALAEATEAVNSLFADADHKNIVEGLDEYRITTVQAIVNKLEDGDDKTKLDELVTKASLLIATKDEEKVEADKEVPATTEKEEETTAPKEDVKKEDVKKEEEPAKAPKKLEASEVGTEPASAIKITDVQLYDVDDKGNKGAKLEGINLEGKVYVEYGFVIPKGTYNTEDEYSTTFDLPSQFKKFESLNNTFEVDNTGTKLVYDIKDGKVKIHGKFTSDLVDLLKKGNATGEFFGVFGFDLKEIKEDSIQEELVFKIAEVEKKFTLPIIFEKPKNKVVKKGVTYEDGIKKEKSKTPDEIEWTIDINNESKVIEGAKISDILPEGLTYEEVTISAKSYKVNRNGDFTTEDADGDHLNPTYKVSEIQLGKITKPTRVVYKTKIDDAKKVGSPTFTNKASFEGEKGSDTVTTQYGKPLDKTFEGSDNEKNLATWKITFNENNRDFKDVQEVTDTMENISNIKIISVTETPKGGDPTVTEGNGKVYFADNKFTFPKGSSKWEVLYTTEYNRVVGEPLKVKNTAIFNGLIAPAEGEITQGIVTKSVTPDFAKKELTWKVTVNASGGKLPIGTVITDTFSPELTLSHEELKNIKIGNDIAVITEGKKNEFKIKLSKELDDSHYFTYKTSFDPNKLPEKQNGKVSFINEVNVFKENSINVSTSATQPIEAMTQNNGEKKGVYDPRTHEITWISKLNYNLKDISKSTFTDTWTGTQYFMPDTFKVYKLDVEAGQGKGEPKGDPLKKEKYNLQVKNDGFTLNFTDKLTAEEKIQAYYIEYKTKVIPIDETANGNEEHLIANEYTNEIKYRSGEKDHIIQSNLVNPPNAGKYFEKNGIQNGDNAIWTINVNKSGSLLPGTNIIEDKLGEGQRLDPNSISMYKTNDEKKVNILNENNLKVEGNKIKITLGQLTEEYTLSYESTILANHGDSISNTANFINEETKKEIGSSNKSFKVDWVKFGGSASIGGSGKLKITKVGPNGDKLAGAEFGIYSSTEPTKLIENVTTNSEGLAETKLDFKFKDYIVKELKAPDGYSISEEMKNGKVISIDSKGIEVKNQVDFGKCTQFELDFSKTKFDIKKLTITQGEKKIENEFDKETKILKISDLNGFDKNVEFKIEVITLDGKKYEIQSSSLEFGSTNKDGNYDCKAIVKDEDFTNESDACTTTTIYVTGGTIENPITKGEVVVYNKDGKEITSQEINSGKVNFNTYYHEKGYDIKVEIPGYKTIAVDLEGDCEVTVDVKATDACAEITATIKDGIKVIEGAKVQILDQDGNVQELDTANQSTKLTTNEKGQVTIPTKYATGDYNIKVSKTGYKTAKVVFDPTNCIFTVDFNNPTLACDNIEFTFTNGTDHVSTENKVYVIDSNGDVVETTKLNSTGQATIYREYADGMHKIVFVQDGKENIVTDIDAEDCKQTIDVSNLKDCPATTIVVKDNGTLIANATVTITNKVTNEKFTEKTNADGKVVANKYYDLTSSDIEVKIHAIGYNTAKLMLKQENCEAVVDLNENACPDYAINAVDQDGKVITNEDFLKGSEFEISGDTEVIEGVKINDIGELVNADGKVLSKVELKASKTAEYTLVQTKTAPGFKKLDDQKVQDLDDCSGLVTINLNKTNDKNNPGASCPDFSVTYKGPENSTAEFKIVKVEKSQGTDGKDVVTETLIEENIKVKTDADTKISSLVLTTKSFEPGEYQLIQTKSHSGFYNAPTEEFIVEMGKCVEEFDVTNSPIPPTPAPSCTEDTVVKVTDTDGKKVSTDNAKVTVDGNETPVTTADGTVIIPKDLLDSAKESTIIITLEDGRTTTVVLPKDRVECTADAKVPVLKVCEENPTITVKDKNGKDVPTDKIAKVTVNGKEVTPTIENGKVVIPKDSVNPKVDSVVTVTTKGGEEGTVTIPKFSENCDYTIVINNTCDALTVNVTENGKKAENGTVSIIDQNGKVVATQKVTENGKVSFPAKYVDSSYSVKVTIGKTTQIVPVNANENCEVTVNVKTIACEKATIHVTLDGKPVSGATVITLDKNDKEIDVDATDKKGNVSIDPIYANKDHKFEVTVEEESKVVEFTGCDISIGFKTKPVVDGETEEPNKPGKPDQPEKPTTPPTKPEKPTTPPTKPTTPPTTVDGDSEENAGNHTVKPNNKYDIYDENGNLIHHNAGVDKNGQLEVGKLPAGTYTFVNDKGEKVTVKVGKDGQLPQTGSDNTMLFGLAGVALLGAGLFLIGRNRKRNA